MVVLQFFFLFAVSYYAVLAQDQTGFISLDCGIPEDSSYRDNKTGINYISDAEFINTGISQRISSEYESDSPDQQFLNLRSFPEGDRNCYSLKPQNGAKGNKYLIRAYFMYGNYDGKDEVPEFDLYLDVNFWTTVDLSNAWMVKWVEIIAVASMDFVSVCLVNTSNGTPFISAIELRSLQTSMYKAVNESWSLVFYSRSDVGSTSQMDIRFPDDRYDRIWNSWNHHVPLNTSSPVDDREDVGFKIPSAVMKTAATTSQNSSSLTFVWSNTRPNSRYHVFMHFAEIEQLESDQLRQFNIYRDDELFYGPWSPLYLSANTIFTTNPMNSNSGKYSFSIDKTMTSTLSPILNALEFYTAIELLESPTEYQDVISIMNIKTVYQVKRNWMGDPCAPRNYSWDGLRCSYIITSESTDRPRIISLNLASFGLSGEIADSLANLTSIEYLDLSSNNLTGSVPIFLSKLSSLKFLNLTSNHLTGSIPLVLLKKANDGLLSLSAEDNPNLCVKESCHRKKNIILSILIPSVSAIVGLLIISIILMRLKRRKKDMDTTVNTKKQNSSLAMESRQFTYEDILSITNNFQRVIGKGGFGIVYHGYQKDDTPVAVKVLSESSSQGFKEFQTEAQLLMRVHHRNLASFFGYCDEGKNMALIYEYMAKGNLRKHLSASNRNSSNLSWEQRLRIAVDAAQGLEYLHNGCKPPIIHRDVKTTNILLNEKLEAKLSDFGLSKPFMNEGITHISTAVMGTPGYLDPEYYISNKLNERSDVYSFGIVLFELITGQEAIIKSSERIHIVQWVSSLVANGDIENLVDPSFQGGYEVNSVWKVLEIAMACTANISIQRPFMSEVVRELKDSLVIEVARERTRSGDSVNVIYKDMESAFVPLAR